MARWLAASKRSQTARMSVVVLLATIALLLYVRRMLASAITIEDILQPDNCTEYIDTNNIAIIVKTGATEAHRLIPTLLKTSLRCIREPLIVSDLDQVIDGVHLHDVLADFQPRAVERNPDWEIYHAQQRYVAEGREKDIPKLSHMPIPHEDWRTAGKSAAWGLDKYKNIRMVDLAWRLRPDREWYFFIDADTYVVWNSLKTWLSTMDHTKRWYIGQPVRMREHSPEVLDFAYGGAGILLSGAAVREYARIPGLADRWDRRIQGWWYGDFMLADALLEEMRLTVTDGTPMLAGDSPAAMALNQDNWCRPVVTMHHMGPEEAKALYKLDRGAGSELLLAKDIYHGVPREPLLTLRADWDNKSEHDRFPGNVSSMADRSQVACQNACQSEEDCFQYTFKEILESLSSGASTITTKCFLSSKFRTGQQRMPNWTGQIKSSWTSGWMVERISSWVDEHRNCTASDLWRFGPGVRDG